MAKINLLPWREEQRKERKRQFFSMTILCVILSGMVMLVVNIGVVRKISNQNDRNAFLQSEIQVLDSQIKEIEKLEKDRSDLEQRMKIIQDLQQSRPLIVHLFDEIPRLLPDGLYLTEIERKADNSLIIKGRTESNPRVSSMMRNIENSAWLTNAQLDSIVADRKSASPVSDFLIRATPKDARAAEKPKTGKGGGQ